MEKTTVLIVDDERGPRESLRMILSPEYHVITSDSGVEGLEILRSTEVDLVTVDLNMPGMKGEELIRLIREEFPRVEMVIITGFGSIETAVEGIRYGVFDYLTKPFDVVQVMAAVGRAIDRRKSRLRLVEFLEGVGSVLGRNRETEDALDELQADESTQERLRSVINSPVLRAAGKSEGGELQGVEFLEVLAETIENRDDYMRGHARRTAFYAGLLADRVCLAGEELELVRLSAFLHDIGKVGIPLEIVTQPGRLLPRQRDHVKEHPAVGERLVKPLGFSGKISTAIRHHHERWDGGGYPDGLIGAETPMVARMIAIADAFDAMTCERPYRDRLSVDEAIQELRKHAGSQFDPHLAEEFIDLIESGAADCVEQPEGPGFAELMRSGAGERA